jgi:hypothetical protein
MENFNNLKIETLLQFATLLAQVAGTFILKPELLIVGSDLVAGNFSQFILLSLSVFFVYLSILFKEPQHARYWIICSMACCVIFCFSFFTYNKLLETKTFSFSDPEYQREVRLIKGDHYNPSIKKCAQILRKEQHEVDDMEVITSCANMYGPKETYKIWPKAEISHNAHLLFFFYFLALTFGSITIIAGLQAIKCKTQ